MSKDSLAAVKQSPTEQVQMHNRELVLSSCITEAGTFELVAVAKSTGMDTQRQPAQVRGNALWGAEANLDTDLQLRFIPQSPQGNSEGTEAERVWSVRQNIVPDPGAPQVFWSSFDEALHVPKQLNVVDVFTLVTWSKLGEKEGMHGSLSRQALANATTAWRRRLERLVSAQGGKAVIYGGGLLPETKYLVKASESHLVAELGRIIGYYSNALSDLRSIAPGLEQELKEAYKGKVRFALTTYLPTIIYRHMIEAREQGRKNASEEFRNFVQQFGPIIAQILRDIQKEVAEFEFDQMKDQWYELFEQVHGQGDKKQFWKDLKFFTQRILEDLGLLSTEQSPTDSLPVAV